MKAVPETESFELGGRTERSRLILGTSSSPSADARTEGAAPTAGATGDGPAM